MGKNGAKDFNGGGRRVGLGIIGELGDERIKGQSVKISVGEGRDQGLLLEDSTEGSCAFDWRASSTLKRKKR
jgi:hypothetical protein